MEPLSKLFGKSKQAYYKYDENVVLRKAAREAFVIEYVRSIRAIDPGIGGPKLWLMYKREFGDNDTVGRDTFEDILDRRRRTPATVFLRSRTLPRNSSRPDPTNCGSAISHTYQYGLMTLHISSATYPSFSMPTPRKSSAGASALHWRPFTLWKPLRWLSNALMASKRLTLSIIQTAAFSTPAASMCISCKRTISRSA